MNDWDPMMMDYHDGYFNSYSQGVGRNLSSGNRTSAQIFVDNFPVDVGEEGLVNLFSDFGTVVSAELKASKRPDGRHTFGFVIMADPAAAAEAISVLNGRRFPFSTLPLKVKPAITNEEKERRKANKQIERDILGPYADSDIYSLPEEPRIRRPLEYDFPNLRNLAAGYAAAGNRVMNGPYDPRWDMDDRRSHLSYGRGRLMDQFRGPGPRPPFAGRGQRLHEHISPGPGICRGSLRPPTIRGAPRVSQMTKIKLCIHCGKEDCTNRCSRCKMYYCSLECQHKDWPNHKNVCIDVSLHHETLYGAEQNRHHPTSKGEIRNGIKADSAPGAWSGKNANKQDNKQKDQDMAKRKSQPSKKEQQPRPKNQPKASDNKSKSNYSSESDSPSSRNKENIEKQQKNQTTKSNANKNSRANDNDKKNSMPNKKDSTLAKNKEDAESPKKKSTQGKLPKESKQDEAKGEVKNDKKSNFDDNSMPKAQIKDESQTVKSQQKNAAGKRVEEAESCKAGSMDGSGDAPSDLGCDFLMVNSSERCYVSSYESPNDIWVAKAENFLPFLESSALFTECIKDVPQVPMSDIKVGDLYCLVYDEVWSRARVITVHGDSTATVMFPDFGNKDVVNISDLKPLVPDMLVLPAQAIHCCLYGIKPQQQSAWGEEAIAALKSWLGEILTKEFTVTCHAKRGEKFAVEFSSDEASPKFLTELLLSGNHAEEEGAKVNQTSLVRGGKKTVERFQADQLQTFVADLSIGQKVDINIMVFKSVGHFVGQVVDKISALPQLEEILAKLDLDNEDPYRPVLGELVLAKYHVDNKWYRSEVTNLKEDAYSITFIDYGNEETIGCANIRHIQHASILEFPRFSISFGFHGFNYLSRSNLDEFAELLEEYTLETGVWRVITLEKKNSIVFVDFISEKKTQSMSELLCKKLSANDVPDSKVKTSPQPSAKSAALVSPANRPKVADSITPQVSSPIVHTESLPVDATTTTNVTVSYVLNAESFFVRLTDKQESLMSMMMELNNHDNLTPLEQVQRERLAAVQSENIWYRVKVVTVEDDLCKVFFVDYGNTETVRKSSLYALSELLAEIPTHAIHCSLDVKSSKLPSNAFEQLKPCEETDICVKVLRKEDKLFVVQLYKADGSLLIHPEADTMTQKKNSPVVATPMLSDLKVKEPAGPDMDVRCVHFEDISEFYCVQGDDIVRLAEMSNNLASFYEGTESSSCQEPVLGGIYGCVFDSEWYRCAVEQVKGETVTVRYIDFGNYEKRSFTELKPLDHKFLTLPVCVFRCKLHGIEITADETNHNGLEEYKSMLCEKLKLHESHITFKGKEGNTHMVSLSLSSWNGQSVDIAADVVGVGLAKWTGDAQPPQEANQDSKDEESEDEDDKRMRELLREMEEIKIKKKKKATK